VVNLSEKAAQSAPWATAVASLQTVNVRPEIILEEVPAPARLAPHSVAIAADVVNSDDEDLANGRFVVLHDPQGQDTWDGPFRIVTFIKASIEADVVTDEIFDEVAWSWLTMTLEESNAAFHNISGTVTRTVSRSFAGLEDRAVETELELRASWSPETEDLAPHLTAWTTLLEMCAGLVPLPPGVTSIVRNN
jgi:hypothetical protein